MNFDPQLFRKQAQEAGFDPRAIEQALQMRMAQQQAPQAVSSGALTTDQALSQVGGLGSPGAQAILDASGNVQDESAKEAEVKSKSLANTLGLIEQERQEISPFFRGRNRLPQFQRIGMGSEIPDFEGLRETTAFELASVVADQSGRALSDEDRQAFLRALPSVEDTDKQAKEKLQNLSATLAGKLRAEGVDDAVISQMTSQIDSIFAKDQDSEVGQGNEIDVALARAAGVPEFSTAENTANMVPIAELKKNVEQQGEQVVNEGYSLGGLAQNAANDVQDMVQGILNIPQMTVQLNKELQKKDRNLLTAGWFDIAQTETGEALIDGTIEQYKNLLTNPLEEAYNHPVNTILEVIPFLKGAKELKGVSKLDDAADVARATSKLDDTAAAASKLDETSIAGQVVAEVDTPLQMTDEVAAASDVVSDTGKRSNILPQLPSAGDVAARTYSTAFVVPTKRASSLKPLQTSAQMLDYGIVGGLDELSDISSAVTGSNGVLSRVTRNAIGNVQGAVDISNATRSAKNILDKATEITPTEYKRIIKTIEGTSSPRVITDIAGETDVLRINALDAYDQAKTLEKLGHQYLNSSTYLTGNIKNEFIGRSYLAAADEIMAGVEDLATQQGLVDLYKTPEVIAELNAISPKLAQEFQNASTIAELRSLQAPFVRLNQMIELTNDSANSAFMRTGGLQGRVSAGTAGLVGGSVMGGLPGAAIGALGGAVFGPPIQSIAETLRPGIVTRTAGAINRLNR